MGQISSGVGLVSGINTAAIIEQLLAIVSVKTPRPVAQPGNAPNTQPK